MKDHIYIIAEAGVNHNGDIGIAKRLVDEAAAAGADAVKFQTFRTQNLVCRKAQKAAYQMETTEQSESQYDMLKKLELTAEMHEELISYCKKKKDVYKRQEIMSAMRNCRQYRIRKNWYERYSHGGGD